MKRKPGKEIYATVAALWKRVDPYAGFIALEDLKERNPSKATSDRLACLLANMRFSNTTDEALAISEQAALEAVVAYHHGPLAARVDVMENAVLPSTDLAPYLVANRLLCAHYADTIDAEAYDALCAGHPNALTLNRLAIIRHELTDLSPADRQALDTVIARHQASQGMALS